MSYLVQSKQGEELNRLHKEDMPIHEWYRFVLSFPPHLVRHYIKKFNLSKHHWVLDPFCGTGTTLVECKKNGISSVGFETNPMVQFAAQTKVDWDPDPDELVSDAKRVTKATLNILKKEGIEDDPLFQPLVDGKNLNLRTLDNERERLLIKDSMSPIPLHKALVLIENLDKIADGRFVSHEKTALAKQLVYTISNLRFGPEVGIGKIKGNTPVVAPWLMGVKEMADDLRQPLVKRHKDIPAFVKLSDARSLDASLEPLAFDAVITSPPYPNEKDYTRTTRLESVLLGFINNLEDLRRHKQKLLRSNTRAVYKTDTDESWIENNERVQELANKIESRRIELGKTSGFEKLYARVVRLYFGGMARHLEELKRVLVPGAQLAYVVGDQASYFRIMIRTGEIISEIAKDLGYETVGIDLFRTRFSTVTQEYLREEVVLLRWNG
jgi:DNA modification methylase